MKVVITTDGRCKDFDNFMVFENLKELKGKSGIDTIVYHDSNEQAFSVGVLLSDLYKSLGAFKFVYINDDPQPMIMMCLGGIQGVHYFDEFYLDDEAELLSLISELDAPVEDTTLVAVQNVDIIKDFVEAFIKGDSKIETPLYQNRVTEAINALGETINMQNTQLAEISDSALEVFEKASTVITRLSEKTKELQELTNRIEDIQPKQQTISFGNSTVYYPPQTYGGPLKSLLIKQYTPCRYLISFLFGFKTWLHVTYGKKVRLVIVTGPNNKILTDKYAEIKGSTIISSKNASMSSMYQTDVLILEHPKKEAFTNIWAIPYDLTIIVDMDGYKEDIVKGPNVKRLNAVAGLSDIKRLNLKAKETILSVVQTPEVFISIGHLSKYVKDEGGRKALYNKLCVETSDVYENLRK